MCIDEKQKQCVVAVVWLSQIKWNILGNGSHKYIKTIAKKQRSLISLVVSFIQ